jgi:hypothetical protein
MTQPKSVLLSLRRQHRQDKTDIQTDIQTNTVIYFLDRKETVLIMLCCDDERLSKDADTTLWAMSDQMNVLLLVSLLLLLWLVWLLLLLLMVSWLRMRMYQRELS